MPAVSRYLVSARLKAGSAPEVRRLLRDRPPVEGDATSLERHYAFLADDEITMLFEGPHAEEEAERLLSDDPEANRLAALRRHLEGPPRRSIEAFAWERDVPDEGISYEPLPGPGDSEGGPVG
jgi:hypothetical protein